LAEIEGLGKRLSSFWQEYGLHTQTKTRDTREYGYHYLSGILRIEKARTIAEISRRAGVPYQNMHHYMSESPWSGPQVIKQARTQIAWHPHFATGSMLPGRRKCGCRSGEVLVGVGRQYNGRLGKVDRSQVGVFLSLIKRASITGLMVNSFFLKPGLTKSTQALRQKTGVPEEREVPDKNRTLLANAATRPGRRTPL
jgi:SRSO17 transposase